MSKIVLKTILNTFLGIIAGLVLVWGFISLFFPKCFVQITYNMGMEKVSAWYAASSYVRTRDLNDLATATEMSIFAGNDKQVVKYGGIFIRMDGFEEYCKEIDEDSNAAAYDQWIYGQLAVSYYRLGEKDSAVKTAFKVMPESFNSSNAVFTLVIEVVEANDGVTALLMKQELVNSNVDKSGYYDTIISFLDEAINSK